MKLTVGLILLLSLSGCAKGSVNNMNKTDTVENRPAQLTYLALGDSYTIGEAVEQQQNFPYQLVNRLNAGGLKVADPKIIAKTGWTTGELTSAIESAALTSKYDIVTLLIGVNNQYRGYSITAYRTEFATLLQTAINFAGKNTAHVFVVSIPDWGATPYGLESGRGQQNIAKEIDAFNAVNKEETLKAGVSYIDITPGSRNAATDTKLVAADGLHPSGKMYTDWVNLLTPVVTKALTLR